MNLCQLNFHAMFPVNEMNLIASTYLSDVLSYICLFIFNEIKLKGEILDDGIYVIEWFCWGICCWVSPQSYIAC